MSSIPINGCFGNHELYDSVGAQSRALSGNLYKKYYPYPFVGGVDDVNSYFSFDYGPAHIVILDHNILHL